MDDQREAEREIWRESAKLQLEYLDKMTDLHRTVVAVSGVMLSVLAAVGLNDADSYKCVLALAMLLLMLALLSGCWAIRCDAVMSRVAVDQIGQWVARYTPVEILRKIERGAAKPIKRHLFAENLSWVCFCIGAILLGIYLYLRL